MKLPIENWLGNSDAPGDAMRAFGEGVTCYKAGAYRAGLLFSYTGMGLWLRRRVLTAGRPPGMSEGEWDRRLGRVRDDSTWDKEVFELTQMKDAAKAVFRIDEHYRDEYKHWKNRRNDCAHVKPNAIEAPHVEAFWLFLRSSIALWVPNGSEEDLLERFSHHFDPNRTPPEASVAPVAARVRHAVAPARMADFFESLLQKFTDSVLQMVDRRAILRIHDAILDEGGDAATKSLEWLRAHPGYLSGVLRRSPSKVQLLHGSPEDIRNLWREWAFKSGRSGLPIVAALLRNGMVPPEQTPELIEHTLTSLGGEPPSGIDEQTLAQYGFWEKFREKMLLNLRENRYRWCNRNARIITWWVKEKNLDDELIAVLCSTFAGSYCPFEVRDALKSMLASDSVKATELATRAAALSLSAPKSIL